MHDMPICALVGNKEMAYSASMAPLCIRMNKKASYSYLESCITLPIIPYYHQTQQNVCNIPDSDVFRLKRAFLTFSVEYSTRIEISEVEKFFFQKYILSPSTCTVSSLFFFKIHKDILFSNGALQK